MKTLKGYERVDKVISQAALSKFCQHLWYLSEEIAALSLFDDTVDEETKVRIVANLERECLLIFKRCIFQGRKKYRGHCMVSGISNFSILSYLLIDILILKLVLSFICFRKKYGLVYVR